MKIPFVEPLWQSGLIGKLRCVGINSLWLLFFISCEQVLVVVETKGIKRDCCGTYLLHRLNCFTGAVLSAFYFSIRYYFSALYCLFTLVEVGLLTPTIHIFISTFEFRLVGRSVGTHSLSTWKLYFDCVLWSLWAAFPCTRPHSQL